MRHLTIVAAVLTLAAVVSTAQNVLVGEWVVESYYRIKSSHYAPPNSDLYLLPAGTPEDIRSIVFSDDGTARIDLVGGRQITAFYEVREEGVATFSSGPARTLVYLQPQGLDSRFMAFQVEGDLLIAMLKWIPHEGQGNSLFMARRSQ